MPPATRSECPDLDGQDSDPVRTALAQPGPMLLAAHAGVHPVAEPVQPQRARLADAGRSTSYQYGFHEHCMIGPRLLGKKPSEPAARPADASCSSSGQHSRPDARPGREARGQPRRWRHGGEQISLSARGSTATPADHVAPPQSGGSASAARIERLSRCVTRLGRHQNDRSPDLDTY